MWSLLISSTPVPWGDIKVGRRVPNHSARVLRLHAWIGFPGSALNRAMHSLLVGDPRSNT